MKINLKVADITQENVWVIVNAANSSLMGGGGVDAAIHEAGGPAILEECRKLRQHKYPDGLPTGHATYTTGGNMPCKYVIHTVGPIYPNCGGACEDELAQCYTNSLKIAHDLECTSISFPAISTGVFGYPKRKAARIAYKSVMDYLVEHDIKMEVNFVFSSEENKEIFEKVVKNKN